MPIPPPPVDALSLGHTTPQPKQPAPLPVPLGIGIDVSAYLPTHVASPAESKSVSGGVRVSQSVRQSEISNLSLSDFSRPPAEGELPAGLADTSSLTSRQSTLQDVDYLRRTSTTDHSRLTTNVVTEGGVEFELFAPHPPSFDSGRYQSLDSQQEGLSYDVTSLLVADLSSNRISALRRASSPSLAEPISAFALSPALSEIGEIHQAAVVARETSQRRTEGGRLRVEGRGRAIPPRAEKDEVHSQVVTRAGTQGLSSNPRRVAGSPRQSS